MRIINPSCGAAPDSNSGGEVHERELLGELRDVHVLISPAKPLPGMLNPLREPLWPARGLRWWVTPFTVPSAIVRCARAHGRGVIRAHSIRGMGLACLIAGRRLGLPVLAHVHHLDGGRLAWLDRFVLRRADAVTTDSEFSAGQVRRIAPGQHVISIPCGVGPEFCPDGQAPHPLVLFLGGLKPRKNVEFLLRVWRRVRVPGAQLVIAGNGPEFPRLQAMATDMPTVGFRTDFDDRVKVALYQRAMVFAFPSLLEGFGMPPLEAQACGVPAIVSQSGSLPEVVQHGLTGYVLPLHEGTWADALESLLTDATGRGAMGGAAAHWARSFTWERTAHETVVAAQRLSGGR